MLVDLGGVDARAVSLLANVGYILVVTLPLVLLGGSVIDVLATFAVDFGSDVLVVGVSLLVVHDRLDFLMDLSLIALTVNDRGDLMVSVLLDVLLRDGVLDVPRVGTEDMMAYQHGRG